MRDRPERQFYFRLAGHLGMPVWLLLRSMPSRELTEWQIYEQVSGPLGSARGDVHAGIVAATVAAGNSSKGHRPTPADFIPKWDKGKKLTPEELWAKVTQANQALGGSTTKREG